MQRPCGYSFVRRVHNHLGTLHAIALCHLAELSAGMMTDAKPPTSRRWLPKGMAVACLRKAAGTLRGVTTPEQALVGTTQAHEWPVQVELIDAVGEIAFRARLVMWISPRQVS